MQSYILRDLYGVRLAYTDEAKKILNRRRAMEKAGTPLANASSKCYPAPTWSLESMPLSRSYKHLISSTSSFRNFTVFGRFI